jgi:uncharacterized protein
LNNQSIYRILALMAQTLAPTVDRAVNLSIQGDIGIATLHRAAGWIASQVLAHTGAGTKVGIWTSEGAPENIRAVADGTVDVSMAVPAILGRLALEGRGPFAGAPCTNLRALGTLPQLDRLLVAVRADLGIRTFADIVDAQPALRIATPSQNSSDFVGWAARQLLAAAGLSVERLLSWGGKFIDFDEYPLHSYERNYPGKFPELVHRGEADVVIHEAMMLPQWQQAVADPGLVFLPVDGVQAETFQREYSWPTTELPSGYFDHQDTAVPVLDFADFLVICRRDLPDDLAHLIAWCMGETRMILEAQYRHIPARNSTLTYPLDPAHMAETTIPLHPGAARYWSSAIR